MFKRCNLTNHFWKMFYSNFVVYCDAVAFYACVQHQPGVNTWEMVDKQGDLFLGNRCPGQVKCDRLAFNNSWQSLSTEGATSTEIYSSPQTLIITPKKMKEREKGLQEKKFQLASFINWKINRPLNLAIEGSRLLDRLRANTHTVWPKASWHLTITPICGPSPDCWHKVGCTQLSWMPLHVGALNEL